MSLKKKKIRLVSQHATSADDSLEHADPSIQFKGATSSSHRTSKINISSHVDVFESKPVKKEEETDPSEIPTQDACPPINQVRTIVKKEELDDGFSAIINGDVGPSASPMANSNSEKKEIGADKPVKVEKYDIDEDPLENTSRVAVNNRHEYGSRKSKSTLSTNRVKKEELDVKKEEMDDNLGAVVYVVASPPPSTNRNSSFAKRSLKSTGLISSGLQSSTRALSHQLDETTITKSNGNDSSVVASQSVGATRRSDLVDSPIEKDHSKNETTDSPALEENNSAALAHGIVKKEELEDNFDIVSNLDRPPLTSSKPSSNFEKREIKKSALQSDRSMNKINLHGSHSRVANTAPSVPSEANNSKAFTEATSKAATFRHETIQSNVMEVDTAAPLDELSVPKHGEITSDMVDRDNATPDLESDRNDDIRSDKDCNPGCLQGSYSGVAKASFIIPSELKNSTSTLEATKPETSRLETIDPYAMEVDTTAPLDETNVPREDRRTTDMVDTANQSSDSHSDYNDDDGSDEDFDTYSKRRHHLSSLESDTESDSEAANQDVHDDDNSRESGESNDNKAAMDGKDPSSKDDLQCLDCAAVFKTNTEFLQHIGSHKGYKRFQCDVCQKRFFRNANLKNHQPIHSGAKPFKCSTCATGFSDRSTLRYHIYIHAGVRPYKCYICEKSFKRNADVQRHTKIHTGKRPYKCSICGKMFSRSTHLKRHIVIHTGERPYKCSICEKSFKGSGDLQTHTKIHTGGRPYKCSICGKIFSRSAHLTRHNKIHTGERPYNCSICGKSFSRSTHLKTHNVVHTGERPYKCSICGQSFGRNGDLTRHIKIHADINPGDLPDVQLHAGDQSSSS